MFWMVRISEKILIFLQNQKSFEPKELKNIVRKPTFSQKLFF